MTTSIDRELDWEPVLNPPELDELPDDLPESEWWAWIHQHKPSVYKAEMEKGIKHADVQQSMAAYANQMMWSPWERRMYL
jgi:hypothetical protein